MSITFRRVSHAFDQGPVLRDVDLAIEAGEIMTLLGPSGSGKTTLLRLAAGLEVLQSGEIDLGDMRVTPEHCPPPESRPTGLVFQQHALFPHLTVAANVAFGLGHLAPAAREARARDVLERAGLGGELGRYPHALSGGQQQRVALARALAPAPALMLLDEPFASVDVLLRRTLREETRLLLKEASATTLLVTHDPEDALSLADRIAVIVEGQIVQVGTPAELWRAPAHPFVAEVLAGRQLIRARVEGADLTTAFGRIHGAARTVESADPLLAIDAFAVELRPDADGLAEVADVRFAGHHSVVIVTAGSQTLRARVEGAVELRPGQRVTVGFDSAGVIAYDANASH